MKDKRVIIVIIVVLTLVLGFSVYFVYTNIKQSDLITTDTLFLCKADTEDYVGNTGHLELVKASEEKHEKDVCNGEFTGKYVCQNEYCGSSIGGQWMTEYADYEKGIVKIRDASEEASWKNSFLYDFKNNKKLTEDLGFLMIVYNKNKKDKTYFLVENKNEDYGIIDNNGKTIIDFKYDDVGFNITSLENNSRDILLENKGIIFLRLKDKLGIYDLEEEKLITKMNLDKIGYYSYDGEYVTPLLDEVFSQVDNYNLNQIYVEEDKVGKIINYKTGEVVKTLDKTYDFVLPLDDELILVYDNKTTDILDKNNKSVLKEKIQGEANFNWTSGGDIELNEDIFKNIIITTKDKIYEFNIETRKLSEKTNSLITKDTLFLCPGIEEDSNGNIGHLELVMALEGKQESEVCSNYVGKYECPDGNCYRCDNLDCRYLVAGQSFVSYINSKTGIASIYDTKSDDYSSNLFLYDFKNNKKLTSEMGFGMEVYRENDTRYFFVNQHEGEEYKTGLIDSYGKTIIPFDKYDDIDICEGCSAPSGYGSIINNGVVAVLKNKKYGFVDIKTGKELTKIEFDSYGFSKGEESSPLGIFIDEEIANRKLKLVYVISNNEGKIINFTTGEVIRTLDKVYKFAFPLTEELVLVVENKKIDILDKNNKSILKEKLNYTFELDLYWNNKDNYNFNNYDFKEYRIIMRDSSGITTSEYIFDIENKILNKF